MRALILRSTLNLFLFAVLWSCWMLFVGAIPHLLTGTSIFSLTFEYRDYLLRVFVVFTLSHLFVRQTNFKLLMAIPVIALALQVGINVYDFSEWYSRTFRVNLHELNAQLFVVPVQLAVLAVGLYFCCRSALRTTTRIFATVMLAGSIFSTLGFHLSIVNVTYKPVERIYADNLESIALLSDPTETCSVTGFDCQFLSIASPAWSDDHLLDPQIPIAHNSILSESLASHVWIRRGAGMDHWLGLAKPTKNGVMLAELELPMGWLSPVMSNAFGEGDCAANGAVACFDAERALGEGNLADYSRSILKSLLESPTFIHGWVHAYDLDDDGFVEPVLIAAGRRDNGESRIAMTPIPARFFDELAQSVRGDSCAANDQRCTSVTSAADAIEYPPALIELLAQVQGGNYEMPAKLWVDKALSRNPVLYINRPEYLRYYAFKDGVIRLLTSPQAFSDTTLDLKLTFNLIIGLFSVSWLTFGVFLILFHTRRALIARP